jgi:hypothetical protein
MKTRYVFQYALYSLILCFGLQSCLTIKKLNKIPTIHYPPPGCIKIQTNFYCDQYEITNFNWLEYLSHTRRIYGEESDEYKNALPDQNVWLRETTYCPGLYYNYFGYPGYRDYPVVGITQEQAMAYAKWRSDRVFELCLIRARAIKLTEPQNRDNVFTIERYFRYELDYIIPGKKVLGFPEFSLPTIDERLALEKYNDSMVNLKKKRDIVLFENFGRKISCDSIVRSLPIEAVDFRYPTYKTLLLHSLFGNVAEWLFEKDMVAGGSWNDSNRNELQSIKKAENTCDAYTGFRCVARWKKWE